MVIRWICPAPSTHGALWLADSSPADEFHWTRALGGRIRMETFHKRLCGCYLNNISYKITQSNLQTASSLVTLLSFQRKCQTWTSLRLGRTCWRAQTVDRWDMRAGWTQLWASLLSVISIRLIGFVFKGALFYYYRVRLTCPPPFCLSPAVLKLPLPHSIDVIAVKCLQGDIMMTSRGMHVNMNHDVIDSVMYDFTDDR